MSDEKIPSPVLDPESSQPAATEAAPVKGVVNRRSFMKRSVVGAAVAGATVAGAGLLKGTPAFASTRRSSGSQKS